MPSSRQTSPGQSSTPSSSLATSAPKQSSAPAMSPAAPSRRGAFRQSDAEPTTKQAAPTMSGQSSSRGCIAHGTMSARLSSQQKNPSALRRRRRFPRTSSGAFSTLLSLSVSSQSFGIRSREASSTRFSRARLTCPSSAPASAGDMRKVKFVSMSASFLGDAASISQRPCEYMNYP